VQAVHFSAATTVARGGASGKELLDFFALRNRPQGGLLQRFFIADWKSALLGGVASASGGSGRVCGLAAAGSWR
jgi:hypothetical protein